MIITAILATAVTVKGLMVFQGKDFSYKVASKVTECSLVAPLKAKSTAIQKIPDGLTVKLDGTISGKVTANEGVYTFGVECKEQTFDVSIQVREQ